MHPFTIVVLSILMLVWALSLTMMFRNQAVHNFQMRLLRQVSAAGEEDIRNGRDWKWRYEMLNTVAYNDMVLKFWKPLKVEAWWKDTSFIK